LKTSKDIKSALISKSVGHRYVLHLDGLLALSTNFRLPRKNLQGTNILAYFATPSVTKKDSLMRLTPGVNVIKLFSFVADNEA
jgi:hypothetical protein